VFNQLSRDLGGFKERILPGAFKNALASGNDIRALVDHDYGKLLGRTSAKTLTLAEDDHGLQFTVRAADTSYARDLAALVERGDITGNSFGFWTFPGGDNWTGQGDDVIRELSNIDLKEVTITSIPAYEGTEVSLRVDPAAVEIAAKRRRPVEAAPPWLAYILEMIRL
jgi:HK97 family phage prohead protease